MFRFIKFLEKAGHKCRIYLYSAHEKPTIERVRNNISVGYDQLDATIEWLDGEMEPADGILRLVGKLHILFIIKRAMPEDSILYKISSLFFTLSELNTSLQRILIVLVSPELQPGVG